MDANAAASGFVHLLVSQVSSRLFTFGLNLLIARHLSPEAYGLSSIQFHLLVTTVMMLSREGFRRGCMRLGPQGSQKHVEPWRVLSVAWLVVPLGAVVTAGVCVVVLALHGRAVIAGQPEIPAFHLAVILHGVACVTELLAEPLYILCAVNMRYRLRAFLDSSSLAAKSLLTLALLAWRPNSSSTSGMAPALIFAFAQLAFAVVTLVGYLVATRDGLAAAVLHLFNSSGGNRTGMSKQTTKVLRKPMSSSGRWSAEEKEVLSATAVFSIQAAEKLVLAEGSKMALAGLASSYDQGVVGLVGNLGSLVVRTLFQPLEEVAFAAFSRQRVATDDHAGLSQLSSVLAAVVKSVSVLGLLAVAFGPPNAHLAIQLVYGSRWAATEAPAVLSVYCLYILLLAVNGVTEAFVHAVLDSGALAWSNVVLVGVASAHTGCCLLAISRLGSAGLVWADAANMAMRIAISLWYISRHFRAVKGFTALHLAPSAPTLMVMAAAHAALRGGKHVLLPRATSGHVEFSIKAAALQMALSAVVLTLVMVAVSKTERQTVQAMRTLWRGRKASSSGEGPVKAAVSNDTSADKQQTASQDAKKEL